MLALINDKLRHPYNSAITFDLGKGGGRGGYHEWLNEKPPVKRSSVPLCQ